MGIALSGRTARVPENFSGEIEPDPRRHRHGCVRMPQIMDPRIRDPRGRTNALPHLLHIHQMRSILLAGKYEDIVLDSGKRAENFEGRRTEPDGLAAGF